MQVAVPFLFSLSKADQNAVFLSPSLLQDRCERSWQSRSTCTAVKPARRPEIQRRILILQSKSMALMCTARAFIVEDPLACFFWMLLVNSGCFVAYPPASTGEGDSGISISGGGGSALRRPPTETRPAQAGGGYFTRPREKGAG